MALTAKDILRAKARQEAAKARSDAINADHADQVDDVGLPLSLKAVMALWPEDWLDAWAERAAIMEIDGRLDRLEAEQAAYDDILQAMNRRDNTP